MLRSLKLRDGDKNRGHGRGRGRGRTDHYNPSQNDVIQKKCHDKREDVDANCSQNLENSCYRCGTKGHWSKICQTPEHLCKLYKASLKEKEKEVNFNELHDPINGSTYLDLSDFTYDFTDKTINDNQIDILCSYVFVLHFTFVLDLFYVCCTSLHKI